MGKLKEFKKNHVTHGPQTIGLYWQQIKKHKAGFFVAMIAIPLSSLLFDTIIPYFLSMAIGTFATQDQARLSSYLLYAGIAAGAGIIINLIGYQTVMRHESKVRSEIIHSTMDSLLKKDVGFFANQKIGALTGKFIDFISAHIDIQALFMMRTLSFIINMGIGLVLIYLHAPLVSLVVFALIALLLLLVKFGRMLRNPVRAERKRLIAEINGASADILTNNLTVKTFAKEQEEVAQLDRLSEAYRQAYVKDFGWMNAEGTARLGIMNGMQLFAIVLIAGMLFSGAMELSIAIFTLTYLQRLAGQIFTLGELVNGYDKLFLQAAPMTEMLLEEATIQDNTEAEELVVSAGSIEFKDVSYAYADDKTTSVIQRFSLAIPFGQKVGLVGASGAGKTTITRLLLRFDDVDMGNILIDGQDIADVTQRSLRESIAYVPQEPLLFHRSLKENIAYAHPDASDAEIRAAAERAYATEFLDRLPNGLETVVGERGVKLSGGQRQRIAIARAILKDAPILVLDEATSALDSESEKLIQAALSKLMQNRTSIVIAHRLSTIAKMDRIIVMDNGMIVEDGTHAQLLAKKGMYAKLWAHQSGGFIQEQ